MIPVTVLGGFLGSGKTTALNHLLRHATGRTAVLVNDFGAIAIDAALIEAQEGDLVALSNGCVCCAAGPDLGQSLARLLQRHPTRIVVETSGVSDPWRVAQLVKLEPGLALDAVPVLADATAFTTHLADPWLADTLARQIARADLVVISKCDAATPAQRRATAAAIHRLRPQARTLEIAGGVLPTLIFDPSPPTSRFTADPAMPDFHTWHWRPPGPFDRARLAAVLDALPTSVLRAKGFVRIGATPHLLQLAGQRWSLTPHAAPPEDALILIGTPALPPKATLEHQFTQATNP